MNLITLQRFLIFLCFGASICWPLHAGEEYPAITKTHCSTKKRFRSNNNKPIHTQSICYQDTSGKKELDQCRQKLTQTTLELAKMQYKIKQLEEQATRLQNQQTEDKGRVKQALYACRSRKQR